MDTMRSTRAKQECESAMVNGTVDQVGRPARVKDDGDQDELGAQAVHQTAFGGGETSVAPLQRLAGLAEGRPEQHRTGQAGDHPGRRLVIQPVLREDGLAHKLLGGRESSIQLKNRYVHTTCTIYVCI